HAQAARLNWVADQYNLTAVNSPTFTTDRGYTGNGTTSNLDTGFNPTVAVGAKYALNNAALSLWCLTEAARDTQPLSARSSATNSANINPRRVSDNQGQYAVNTSGDRTITNNGGSSIGFFTVVRTAASFTTSYFNGGGPLSPGNNSEGLPNATFGICGRPGTTSDTRQIACTSLGAAL